MELPEDPNWPRAGHWPPPDGDCDVVLIGLGTHRTSLSPTGAGATPAAIRSALRRYSTALTDGSDLSTLAIADAGDVPEPDGAGEAGAIDAVVAAAERARLLIALGGDNAATVPAALGVWGDNAASAGLVTLDAHHDLRTGVSNGSPVRRLIEDHQLPGQQVVQVGIADFANSAYYRAKAQEYGITVIDRGEVDRHPMADVMARALDIAAAGGGPVHVDLDVDVCDRAVAPGCPASAPGGISAYELRAAARAAGAHPAVASVDITEVDATADAPDQRTVRLAALCVLETAAGLASRGT